MRVVFTLCAALGLAICNAACSPALTGDSTKSADQTDTLPVPLAGGVLNPNLVEDPSGQWASQLRGVAAPVVVRESGYVHVQTELGLAQALHCFVYDAPIDGGQAIARLLKASEVGITYVGLEVDEVRAVQGAPAVFLRAAFEKREKGSIDATGPGVETGTLHVAISTRFQFPVVCTLESARPESRFHEAVSEFLTELSLKNVKAPPEAFVSEIWEMRLGGRPIGYSIFQIHHNADGQETALEVGSSYAFENSELQTMDTVSLQTSDKSGLVSGKWLLMEGTRSQLELLTERQEPASSRAYRYVGKQRGVPIRGNFTSPEVLVSPAATYSLLREAGQKSGAETKAPSEFELLQYRPALDPTLPKRVHYSFAGDHSSLTVTEGESVSTLTLDASGLPAKQTGPYKEMESVLLHRKTSEPAQADGASH